MPCHAVTYVLDRLAVWLHVSPFPPSCHVMHHPIAGFAGEDPGRTVLYYSSSKWELSSCSRDGAVIRRAGEGGVS